MVKTKKKLSSSKKALLLVLTIAVMLPLAELALAYLFGTSLLKLWEASLSGYQTAFQGLQAEFAAVYWQGGWWSQSETPAGWNPSLKQFGYELTLDPDQPTDGWCDLLANQQPLVVEDDSYQPYVWAVGDKQFEIHKVKLKWAVNVWLGGTGDEAADWTTFNIITWEPNYAGAQIWIRLTPRPFKYFRENPDQMYIAPACIVVESVQWASIDQDNRLTLNDPDMSVMDINPGARGENFGIYYQRGGFPINVQNEITKYYYNGLALDPQVFRDTYWIHIDLINFKPINKFEWQIWHKWKYPSVKLEITVYAFIVGVWKVKLAKEEVPQLEPHKPAGDWTDWTKPFRDLAAAIGSWFNNPFNAITFWLFLLIAALIILAVVAPGVLRGIGKVAEAGGKKLAEKINKKEG